METKILVAEVCLYDVCNDYSLDICKNPETIKWSDYRTVRREDGVYFYHKDYDELHYYEGPKGLYGSVLWLC